MDTIENYLYEQFTFKGCFACLFSKRFCSFSRLKEILEPSSYFLLQEDFDIFLSVEDFRNPTLMSRLLEMHIKAYETVRSLSKSRKEQTMNCNSDDGKVKNRSTESRLYKLALLLQRSEQELGEKLVFRALDAGKVEDAVKICR